MKIHSVGAEFFSCRRTDRRMNTHINTERHGKANSRLRNFANAPKTAKSHGSYIHSGQNTEHPVWSFCPFDKHFGLGYILMYLLICLHMYVRKYVWSTTNSRYRRIRNILSRSPRLTISQLWSIVHLLVRYREVPISLQGSADECNVQEQNHSDHTTSVMLCRRL